MQHDTIKISGNLEILVTDKNGIVKSYLSVKNLTVTAGKAVIADRMKSTPTLNAMTHMALGTGTTSPVIGDTTLETEISGSRTALTGTNTSGADIVYTCTFPAGVATSAGITEAGMFNASSGGTMLARSTFAAQPKGSTDIMAVTWTVTVG